MGFKDSAENVRVDDGHILRARLRNANGDMVDAEIDLNNIIGNYGGQFAWGGTGFSGSAQNVQFNMEGSGVPILRASLDNGNGGHDQRDINLDERIGNNNGGFQFDK